MAYKAKQKYRLADGSVCPGTTTITGELGWNKGVLINWANKLGLKGLESRKYVDDKAAIGTLGHLMVLSEFLPDKPNFSDYSANQIKEAENCLASYKEWRGGKTLEPLVVEKMLVSESLRYGGTPDFYGKVNGVLTLIDYKTGKGIYPEYTIQVSAYKQLLVENGHQVDEVRILSIPRADDEGFTEKVISPKALKAGLQIFKHLMAIRDLKGAVKNDG